MHECDGKTRTISGQEAVDRAGERPNRGMLWQWEPSSRGGGPGGECVAGTGDGGLAVVGMTAVIRSTPRLAAVALAALLIGGFRRARWVLCGNGGG